MLGSAARRPVIGRYFGLSAALIFASIGLSSVYLTGVQAQSEPPLMVSLSSSASLPSGFGAVQMDVSPDGRYAYVAAMGFQGDEGKINGHTIFKIDTDSGRILASAAIPGVDRALALTAITFDLRSNRLLVAMSAHLFLFDATDFRLLHSDLVWGRSLYSLISDQTRGRVFGLVWPTSLSGGKVVEINPQDGSVVKAVAYSDVRELSMGGVGYQTPRLAMSPEGSALYALPNSHNELLVIDPQAMSIVNRRNIGESGGSLALSPTAGEVFITQPNAQSLRRFSMKDLSENGVSSLGGRCPGSLALDALGERAVIGHPCGGTPLQLFDPRNAKPLSSPFNILSNGMSLWMRPDGRKMYSLSSSGTAFEAYDIQTREERRVKQRVALPVPSAPRDIRVSLSGTTATVSWRPPVNAKLSKVTQYLLRGSPGALSCTTKSTRTSCRFTGLSQGRTYAFAVQARNATGNGPSAVSAYINVPVPRPPERPAPMPDPKPDPVFN